MNRDTDQAKINIGIQNKDTHVISKLAMELLLNQKGLLQDIQITSLVDEDYDAQHFSCVIVVPEGFVEGVMYGENPSPTLRLNPNLSQFEEVFLRELAAAAETYLAAAQSGVYAIIDHAIEAGATEKELETIIFEINSIYINQFLNKENIIHAQLLSPYTSMSQPRFFLSCGVVFFALVISFLSATAVSNCYKISHQIKNSNLICISGAIATTLLLFVPMLFLYLTVLRQLSGKTALYALGFACISSLYACILGVLTPHKEGQVIIGGATTIALMLLGGCIIPTAMLPEIFSKVAPLTPTYHMRILISDAGVIPVSTLICIVAMTALFLWLWRVRKP